MAFLALPAPRPDSPQVPTCYSSPAVRTERRLAWRVPEKSCVERLIEAETAADEAAAAAEADSEEGEGDRETVSIGKKSAFWDLQKIGDKLQGLEKVDPYGLLELENRRWRASAEELRKSYRRLVLEKHPDKKLSNERSPARALKKSQDEEKAKAKAAKAKRDSNGEEGEEEEGEEEEEDDAEEEEFKLLSAAWELLGDETRRRQFDSIDYFNDSTPLTYKERPDDPDRFYRLFGNYFSRQGKFSMTRPVPQLGDADTPVEEVQAFYHFWGSFKSWRDFTLLADYDTAEAGDREERRWMQRNNKNKVEQMKKVEMKKLFACVELAQDNDPRLLKAKADRAAEKEQARAEKEAALAAERKAKADAEAALKASEDAAAEEAAVVKAAKDGEKAAAKRDKEKLRSALKKARKELKGLAEPGGKWEARAADLEAVASVLPTEEIEALTATLAADDGEAGQAALVDALKKVLS
jgi:DnaJ family protein C protein 2